MLCTKCKKEVVQGAIFCPWCGKKLTATQRRKKRSANGTGSAYKRGNGWVAQAVIGYRELPDDLKDPENSRQRVPIKRTKGGFQTKADALAYVPTLKAGGRRSPDAVPTLASYWKSYQGNEYTMLSESKQTAYRIAWGKLSALQDVPVDQLTVQDLRDTVAKECPTYYPAKDCKALLSALFRLAAADGHVNRDLPSFIVPPKLEEKERETFTDLEQAKIWRLYESGDLRAAPVLLMIYTGMMPGEVIRLRADQIDMDKRIITGAGMKTAVRKKTPVVLAESILPVVRDLIDNAQPDGKLWNTEVPKTWREHYYYPALQAAGCRRLSPYSCRHTTATALAIDKNVAPQTVQKVMRWSSTRMLDRYAHPDQQAALAAVDAIGK